MASTHFKAIPPSTAAALSIALDPTSPLPFLTSPSLSAIVSLPPRRPIIWSPHPQAYARPGILRSDFLGTSHHRVLVALLVQVTGEEEEREPCRRCRDDGGDWVGCVRPSRGEEGRTRGACANCWRDGKECGENRRFELGQQSSTANTRSQGRNKMPSRVPKETPAGGPQEMPTKPTSRTAQTPITLPPKPPSTTPETTQPAKKRAKTTAAQAQAQVQEPAQFQHPVAAPKVQQRRPASIPTIVVTEPEPEPQSETVQETTDLPEIEPFNQDELELFPGMIHPDARHNMSQGDSYCWHEIKRQMDEPLMTNEELADLVDEFYG